MTHFQFDSLRQLLWMEGHGPYVWGCYAIALIAILFLVLSPILRRRHLLQQLRMAVLREQQSAANSGSREHEFRTTTVEVKT
jgi:heme exporter protein D